MPFATANLLVYLLASDFNANGNGIWPNRAVTTGVTPSYASGSFAAVSGSAQPFATVIGGVPAVTFATVNGIKSQYSAASSAFPQTGNTIWSSSDWSVEFWAYSDGTLTAGGYAPVVQWGQRPGTSCDSAAIGIGASSTGGATTFYNCDSPWAAQPMANDGTSLASGFSYQPTPNIWHHVVVTYTGTTSSPQLVLSQYLDGQLNSAKTASTLAIRKDDIRIGSWVDLSANVSIAMLRVHNGVLTAAQVAYNYAQFAPFAVVTASTTPTSAVTRTHTSAETASRTSSPSPTSSPSSTQVLSATVTAASSTTPTVSVTPTSTIQYETTGGVLIYLNAADFNSATGAWDNRATAGAVSYANGDFVPAVGSTAANLPTAGTAGQIPNAAVIFNVTSGASQYLVGNAGLSQFSGMFGTSDWSMEAWLVTPGWTGYHNAGENPVFQWGTIPSPAACGSAFFGAGSDPNYGAVRTGT